MLFSELETITSGKIIHLAEDKEISKFSNDSRKASGHPNELFIAIKGERNDGHVFIKNLSESGITNFIIERKTSFQKKSNVLLVESGTEALQEIAKHHRAQFDYPVIGITGSNGKTTIKEWIYEILSAERKTIKSPKSYNSQVGVSLSVLEMSSHDVGIFEAGISTTNEMAKLANIIQPTMGIFSNIGEAHAQGFDSKEQKIREKAMLFKSCDKIICCRDHQAIFDHLKSSYQDRVVSWSSTNSDADVHFEILDGYAQIAGFDFSFQLPFENKFQVSNLFHAIVVARELNISTGAIEKVISLLRPVSMRLELKEAINNCSVIDDSYNNDLLGLEVAIDFMNEQNVHQTKTLILSDIFQSTLSPEELSNQVSELCQSKGISRIITIGDNLHADGEHFSSTSDFLKSPPTFKDETILVKGSRHFQFEKIVSLLEEKTHGTYLEINFDALRRNLNKYRSLLTSSTKLMVMVKANAYGLGITEVASFLQHERVDYLGVAYLDEAIQLRNTGISIPIMIMNPGEVDFSLFDQFELEAEIYSLELLNRFIDSKSRASIHLKLETGMNRLGFLESDIPELIQSIKSNSNLNVTGIFTHFSSSDSPNQDDYTHQQANRFTKMANQIEASLGYSILKHAVNSSGVIRFPNYHFGMVRLGIGLYGFDPTGLRTLEVPSALKTYVSQIKEIKKGESIGYSRMGLAKNDMRIAILPIGYADGYRRAFGNGVGYVSINNQNAPTVGNICMDITMVDVTGLDVKTGDSTMIFGNVPSVQELAQWADTIPYEIMTGISERAKRVYVSE